MHISNWFDQHRFGLAAVLFFITAVVGPWLAVRFIPKHRRDLDHDLLAAGSGILGVVNAVLLAFIVFAAWTNYDRAEAAVNREADAVSTITRDLDDSLGVADDSMHDLIVKPLRTYVDRVIDTDWPAMEKGFSARNDTSLDSPRLPGMQKSGDALRVAYKNALLALNDPNITPAQKVIGEAHVQSLSEMYQARRDRIGFAQHGSLSDVVWMVVLAGGLLTVMFCAFCGFQDRVFHYTTTIGVAAGMALVFFLIISLDTPFRGPAKIGPDEFQRVKRSIDRREMRHHGGREVDSVGGKSR